VSAPCSHTALHLASENGQTESVRALLENGADVNAADDYSKCAFTCGPYWLGEMSLDGSTRRQRLCAVRLLVERVGAMQGDGAAPRI
jgi:hypothetical protein